MAMKMRCKEVRELVRTMPKGGCEQTLRLISEHLSECRECRSLHAGFQKMEQVLTGRKLRLDEIARHSPMSKSRILAGVAPLPGRRARRLRPAWVGAVVLLLLIAGAAAVFRPRRATEPPVVVTHHVPAPPVTRAMATAASSRVLRNLAEVAQSYEAPPPKILPGPPTFPPESSVPRLLERCRQESEKTLRAIAQSRTNLVWRSES